MPSAFPVPFWLAAGTMVAVALAFVVPVLWSRAPRTRGVSRRQANADVFRAQLADLTRERDSGAIDAAQFAVARAELERRLLHEASDEVPLQTRSARVSAAAVAFALPIAALALYATFGGTSPVTAADVAAAAPADLRAQLVAHLARQPDDGRAWIALARVDFEADRFADAAASYEKALASSPRVARDAGLWCELADALGMAAAGTLVGRPTELVMHALTLDPAHPQALEMAGSAAYERADYRAAARYWRQLVAVLHEGTDAHAAVQAAVARAERLASTTLPPPASAAAPPS